MQRKLNKSKANETSKLKTKQQKLRTTSSIVTHLPAPAANGIAKLIERGNRTKFIWVAIPQFCRTISKRLNAVGGCSYMGEHCSVLKNKNVA